MFNIFDVDYIFHGGGVAEAECYRELKRSKGQAEDVLDRKLEQLLEFSRLDRDEKIRIDSEKINKKIKAKTREINRRENLDNLIKYFISTYNIKVYPDSFYRKLAGINSGNYKGLVEGIPYEYLLDMFKKKQGYLDKVAYNNSIKGKEFIGITRLNYDIAILINKYDEYLNWLNKQKVLESEIRKEEESKVDIKVNYKDIKHESSNESTDVFNILNDIY